VSKKVYLIFKKKLLAGKTSEFLETFILLYIENVKNLIALRGGDKTKALKLRKLTSGFFTIHIILVIFQNCFDGFDFKEIY